MPMSTIAVDSLTKRYGATAVLDNVSFQAPPGSVTGFFGANGAGKSTTLRVLLGLSRPSAGRATIGGRPYRELADPVRTVGAVLEHSPFHPGRSARNALRVITTAAGLPSTRVDAALALVELDAVADERVGRFSLGMRQRLALAAAMLGDPEVLVLDEPTNGLDPAGLRWMRDWLRAEATRGRAVLVSSHLLAEMAACVDRAVVIAAGRVRFAGGLDALPTGGEDLLVGAHDRAALAACLRAGGLHPRAEGETLLRLPGAEAERVGALAAREGIALLELRRERRGSVETALEGFLVPAAAASAPATPIARPRTELEEAPCAV
jgi:ABC-2 type transport system ATP-binding protein